MSAPVTSPSRTPGRPWLRNDFVAGLLLLVLAAFVAVFGAPLKVGTAYRMGPGYVPQLLAWLIGGVGVLLCATSFRASAAPLARWSSWPIVLVLGAMVLFALTIERTGLLVASLLAVVVAGLAAPQSRWRGLLVLAASLATFACLLFPLALQLPLKVWP